MLTAKLLLAYFLSTANVVGINVDTSNVDPEQAYCLAENIYHEAKSENIQGQFAVASVTLNRVRDIRFPRTICEVVKQSSVSRISKRISCAFSWYCENGKKGKEIPVRNKDGSINQQVVDQFQIASIIAIDVLNGTIKDNTNGAIYFHNPLISNPSWKPDMEKTVTIGNHNFYKSKKD